LVVILLQHLPPRLGPYVDAVLAEIRRRAPLDGEVLS
jgi:hypothetical protein